jgi:hypothetical protein
LHISFFLKISLKLTPTADMVLFNKIRENSFEFKIFFIKREIQLGFSVGGGILESVKTLHDSALVYVFHTRQ